MHLSQALTHGVLLWRVEAVELDPHGATLVPMPSPTPLRPPPRFEALSSSAAVSSGKPAPACARAPGSTPQRPWLFELQGSRCSQHTTGADADAGADTWSKDADDKAASAAVAADRDHAERKVTRAWDSTLNATFDCRSIASKKVAMSASERGCAMSHLSLWYRAARLPEPSNSMATSTATAAVGGASAGGGGGGGLTTMGLVRGGPQNPVPALNHPVPPVAPVAAAAVPRKTRMCQYFLQGHCPYAETNTCRFAHSEAEIQRPPGQPPGPSPTTTTRLPTIERLLNGGNGGAAAGAAAGATHARPLGARGPVPPHVLILEDDVRLIPNFGEKLNELWAHVPADVDVLFLGYFSPEGPEERLHVQVQAPPAPAGAPQLFQPRYLWGLHAYAITGAGA